MSDMNTNISCANCAHWEREGEQYNEAIDARRCKYAVHTEDATQWNDDYDRILKPEFKDTKAFTVDGSGYYAAFYTKADYSCNQHKGINNGK